MNLQHLAPGNYQLAVRRIGDHANDPYSRYLELGSPADLSPATVTELKARSTGRPVSETAVTVSPAGAFQTTLPLHANDVYLLTLKRP